MGFALFQDPLAHQGIEMTADSGWSEIEALRERIADLEESLAFERNRVSGAAPDTVQLSGIAA